MTRRAIVDAKVARKLPNLDKVYPIELVAGWGAEGKKRTIIVRSTSIRPRFTRGWKTRPQARQGSAVRPRKAIRSRKRKGQS